MANGNGSIMESTNGNGATTLQQAQVPAVRASFTELQGFELAQRVAKGLAASTLVPQQYQNNVPNCLIALDISERLRASILMVMQNLYVVHGRPGWSSKFLIASFNQCGRFSSIRYAWVGERGTDGWGCRAWSIELRTNEKIEGPLVTIETAKKEGWYSKNGSKWQTIPELMLMYRSGGWLVNTYAPEISMGLNTTEELEDVVDLERGEGGAYAVADLTAEKQAKLREKYAADEAAATAKEVGDLTEQIHATAIAIEEKTGRAGSGFAALRKAAGQDDLAGFDVARLAAILAEMAEVLAEAKPEAQVKRGGKQAELVP